LKRQQRAQNLEVAKKTIGQFSAQVQQNRRSFQVDLVREETARKGRTTIQSTAAMVADADAITDFEKEFRDAIEQSGLSWNDTTKPQLPAAPAIQEDRERRQMARARTLIRAEQIRSRRLKKIKSKTYRRLIRKKEAKGMTELLEKLEADDPEQAERVRGELERKLSTLRLNRQRQARVKWSQAAQRFGGREIRSEVSRQAQAETDEKRELLRAIKGREGEESGSSSEGESDDSEDIVAKVKKSIKNKVVGNGDEEGSGAKGLMGMKFMRVAAEKKKNETIAEAEKFLETLEDSDSDHEELPASSQPTPETVEGGMDTQEDLVASLFADPVSDGVLKKKKGSTIVLKQPENDSEAMPGWGDWIGEGVRQKKKRKTPTPAAEVKAKPSSAIVSVLDDEKLRAPLMKYQCTDIPHPYGSREEFEAANSIPLGPEWNTVSSHIERIQPKIAARIGTVVPPIQLVKHLDPDRRAALIDAWDNKKKVRYTKARMV
jgi:U3 small nucleolar RNA-associated protein 14